MTTFRWYLLGLVALFGLYVAVEYYKPKPLDWRPTYVNTDKIPLGTYVLFDQLPRLLGTDSVETVRVPIYNQLTGNDAPEKATAETDTTDSEVSEVANPDSSVVAESPEATDDELATPGLLPARANYLFVNASFEAGAADTRALLQFVAAGNDAFIAAEDFSNYQTHFGDSLGVHTEDVPFVTRKGPEGAVLLDSSHLAFSNPDLTRARYALAGPHSLRRLVVDSGRVGRTLATDAKGRAVLVRLDYGRGHFYLCSVPAAFANYYALRPATANFAAAAFAYLPVRRTWWDEFQKQGRVGEQSLLRLLFEHDALSWAYYLLCLAALLFVLVEARRRQRIIPTINQLPNTTLRFARTVASLYRQGSNHALIAEKKVGLFMDYLRTRFHETSPDFSDEAFRERLSQKAGVPRPRVDELLRTVNFARTAPILNDQQLLKLSRALSDFRREAR